MSKTNIDNYCDGDYKIRLMDGRYQFIRKATKTEARFLFVNMKQLGLIEIHLILE